jgi:hypothetical protein
MMGLNMVKIIYTLFLFCCLFWQYGFPQSLRFLGEKIEVTIHEDHAEVRGEYHFKNNSDQAVRRTLLYPFVINENLPYPDSISMFARGGKSISFNRQDNAVIFSVAVPPKGTGVYEVFYSQKTPAQKMEYILTTTQRWRQPLSFAEYVIKLPQSLLLKYLSLNPSGKAVDGDYKIYRVFKNNYMPKSNLIVEWARRIK